MVDNMDKLIVIGNGFDLYHGLPSRYSDFIEYIRNRHPSFFEELSCYIPPDLLWSSFEEALGELDTETLLSDNLCYLDDYGVDEWRESMHHDYQYEIENSLFFADDIEELLREWINSFDFSSINPCKSFENLFDSNTVFMSFNYTDTLERLYGIRPWDIYHVHGLASKSNERLIVGHHNTQVLKNPLAVTIIDYEYQYKDVREIEAERIVDRYFHKTFKDTESIINSNSFFFNRLKYVEEIYILGHSLSDIDRAYFIKLIESVNSFCKWNISKYTDTDEKKAYHFVKDLGITEYELFRF